ncbi:MAG: pyridine nucleotide-disulfide oxidoreductase/dicluster-binding protein [Syntrophobacteraceae bacterium]
MEQDELRKLEDQCTQEQPPACAAACPVHVDVRAMMAAVARGSFSEAAKILRRTVPFPGIISRVCDQPCRAVCKRKEAGDPLSVAAIERSCLDYAAGLTVKPTVLPSRQKRVAVVGGGLSGLTAAFDLACKGYTVEVFEAASHLGGSMRFIPEDNLPHEVIERDLDILKKVGIQIHLDTTVGRDLPFDALLGGFEAIYIGTGKEGPALMPPSMGASLEAIDPVTLAAGHEGVFAGGSLRRSKSEASPIRSISDGRIAAISIDRYLQRVSMTASRSGEGSTSTRLFTSTEGVEPLPGSTMAERQAGFSKEEASLEAARCLQCQCLECVKVCEYLNSFKSYPRRYVRQVYNNLSIVMGHRHANKLINSCSLCGLCREVCPEDLHMGLVCKKARETLIHQGKMPPSAHDFPLRDMEFSNSEQCAFSRHQPGTRRSAFLFFPGCQLTASAPDHVRRVYSLLTQKLAGGVGFMARCCGAPADWSGRTVLARSVQEGFLTQWSEMGRPQLILACSTCFDIFRAHLPEAPIVSLWETLDRIGIPEPVKPLKRQTIAVHDACTTRHEATLQQSVRNILARLGLEVEELALTRDKTECCGYGGLMFFANRDLAKSVIRRRIQESPLDFVAYCAMCRDYLASGGKRTYHLLDLIFGTETDSAALRQGPSYSRRHENRVRLKTRMLKEHWSESMVEAATHELIRLIASEKMEQVMEDRQILVEDLQRVIEHAERTGYRLLNRETGHILAHFKPASVTYWVEYTQTPAGYLVHNAYCHRMEIEEGLKE